MRSRPRVRNSFLALSTLFVLAALVPQMASANWVLQEIPTVSGANTHLASVSCSASNACTAVGGVEGVAPLAERWNGTSWSTQKPRSVTERSVLNSVSCVSATFCEAVGSYYEGTTSHPLVESWNGSEWKVQETYVEFSAGAAFNGVSCTSTTSCWAVGSRTEGGEAHPIAYRWESNLWREQSVARPAGAAELKSVSCYALGCTAVGSLTNTNQPLAESSGGGGSWSIQSGTGAGEAGRLEGVSCVSTSFCKSDGWYSPKGLEIDVLEENWNGTTWSPTTGSTKGTFYGMSCASGTACFAVGKEQTGTPVKTIAVGEFWNGFSWVSSSAAAPVGSTSSTLRAASALPGGEAAEVVGSYKSAVGGSGPEIALAEHWQP